MDFSMFAEALIFFLVGVPKEEYMFPHLLVAGLSLLLGCHPCWRTPPELLASIPSRAITFTFKQELSAEHWDKFGKTRNICAIESIAFVCIFEEE